MRKIFVGLLSIIFALGITVPAVKADWNYITLSSYYVFPGQSVSVYGNGFAANESVTVSVAGISQTTVASSSGQFNSPQFTIPYSVIGQTIPVVASGSMGHTSSANLVVANYYPHVDPSSYYIVPGGSVQFFGKNFAPNENVAISGPNVSINVASASNGNFSSGSISVPYSAGNQQYNFVGQSSGDKDSVTIHVAGTAAVIVLNNYYGLSGSYVQITGSFFGNNEKVSLTIGGVTVGSAVTDGNGNFSTNVTVPNFPASSVQNIVATGQTTGKTSAPAKFTIAWNNSVASSGQTADTASPTISVVSVDQPKTNITQGQIFSVTPTIIATGNSAQNVSVLLSLLNPGRNVAVEQVYSGQTLQQNSPVSFQLQAPSSMPANTYTISTTVQYPDSSILAAFPNLGTVVIQ